VLLLVPLPALTDGRPLVGGKPVSLPAGCSFAGAFVVGSVLVAQPPINSMPIARTASTMIAVLMDTTSSSRQAPVF